MDYKKIETSNNSIIIKGVKNFNLKHIFECGQIFRFEEIQKDNFIVIAFGRLIELVQRNNEVFVYNTTEEEVKEIWLNYFDLNRDYSNIKEELSKDELLKQSIEFGYGIRVLNQDSFEMLLSFIISARNNIPSIKKTVNKISEKWGNKIEYKGKIYYSFPTIQQIKDATLDEIKETGASFRSKYLLDTIQNIYRSTINDSEIQDNEDSFNVYNLDYIKKLNDDECHKALQEFKGVGAKVADCIMLFSMGKTSAFPVDVWVKRAMIHFYNAEEGSLNKIRIFARNKFGKLSGFAQQYLFYYARENNIKV
ncbi:DNA-3-methyladenine glycosylase family protein [Clostridium taeniosporum]|uniref:DNA-(apurinic or apyrimidinic site) lyase n=1 Tax=Clostridium taeniosporum TaxID=394958 RepID=A0A1D7XGT9_9CLOT|nr:DNA glycosylase [Clostridium taeniosporum]AOR22522.1 8-oxoguanine DNA glycosylase [Clostridium taeniosporum]